MFSSIGSGYFLLSEMEPGKLYVARKVASSAWCLFEISAADLIRLEHAVEQGLEMPSLNSLRCVRISKTRRNLLSDSSLQ